MNISVIIPTYNSEQRITSTLDHFLSQYGEKVLEVLVVNDGSTDSTSRVLERYREKLMIVNIPHGGRARVRNSGAEQSRGELLWFLDDDVQVDIASLGSQISHFMDQPRSIIAGRILEDQEKCRTDFQRYKRELSIRWQAKWGNERTEIRSSYLSAANFMVPRELFFELGGFDEQLTDLEDHDFVIRAMKANIPIYYDPSLSVFHLPPTDAASYVSRLGEYEKLRSIVIKKHEALGVAPRSKAKLVLKRRLFGKKVWLEIIDKESLYFIPKKLRYWLYSTIISAHIN